MADYLESNFETIGATLRNKASGIRQLAGKILEGEFRGRLLELAQDYEHQAKRLGARIHAIGGRRRPKGRE
jgi:hypothetical protein